MQGFSYRDIVAFCNDVYGGRRLSIVPYGYTVTFSALAAGASATQQQSITGNADFVLTEIRHRSNVAAAGQTVSNKTAPLARLLITDSGSNEQYTNNPVDLENLSVNGEGARLQPFPRWIAGRTSLTLTLTNYDAAQTYNTDIFLAGVLVRAFDDGAVAVRTR